MFGSNSIVGGQQQNSLFSSNTSGINTNTNKPAMTTLNTLFTGGGQPTPTGNTSTNLFNSNPTVNQSTNLFGGQNNIISTQTGTSHVRYQATKAQETSTVTNKVENIHLVAITSMPEFSNKSIDELRSEDYVAKKKGTLGNMGGTGQMFNSMPMQNNFSTSNTGMIIFFCRCW